MRLKERKYQASKAKCVKSLGDAILVIDIYYEFYKLNRINMKIKINNY